jgi:hypothetical protein
MSRGGDGRRVALVVVAGVGDDAPGGTVRTVAHGLVTQATGWRPDPAPDADADADPIRVPVPGGRARAGELYEAPTLRVTRGGPGAEATVDVVEMSWSDLSSFPKKGLIPFFGEHRGYREVVVAAHSQGSMYSVTTIAGDRRRRDPEPGSGGWGVEPWCRARPRSRLRVALLTFGCPIRQTYEARLPGQYAWTREPRLAGRLAPVAPAWINVFRARDYVGRSVFHDPLDPAAIAQGRYRSRRADAAGGTGPELIDACLHGSAGHTGYFGDRELTLWIDHLLRRALGESVPAPPGYSSVTDAP